MKGGGFQRGFILWYKHMYVFILFQYVSIYSSFIICLIYKVSVKEIIYFFFPSVSSWHGAAEHPNKLTNRNLQCEFVIFIRHTINLPLIFYMDHYQQSDLFQKNLEKQSNLWTSWHLKRFKQKNPLRQYNIRACLFYIYIY